MRHVRDGTWLPFAWRVDPRGSVGRLLLLTVVMGGWSAGTARAQDHEPFVEHVEVARVLIDARVVDARGHAILDLEPSQFAVKIGGKPARVESVAWVGGAATPAAPVTTGVSRSPSSTDRPGVPGGRLVVFLVQRDLESGRITGLIQLARVIDRLLQPLTRDDRVAVLSFDSRLRVWTDFTDDLDRVRTLLTERVVAGTPAPLAASADVSLLARLDPGSAGRIPGVERALQRIAEALEPLPGAKSLVVLGYGFGRFDARTGGVVLMDGYDQANAALQRARAAVFTLNVTQADFNSLQGGLEALAADTGGVYASAYHFPAAAVERVAGALAGHYVLFVEKPEIEPGAHRIDVRLVGRRGTVMARRTYAERP